MFATDSMLLNHLNSLKIRQIIYPLRDLQTTSPAVGCNLEISCLLLVRFDAKNFLRI